MGVEDIFNSKIIEQRERFATQLWKGEATGKIAFQIVGEAYGEDKKKFSYTTKETQNEPDKFLAVQLENVPYPYVLSNVFQDRHLPLRLLFCVVRQSP